MKPKKSLIEYFEDGTINDMVYYGMTTPTKLNFKVYSECVKTFMDRGLNKTESVIQTSITCKVCESTVWKSIKTIQL